MYLHMSVNLRNLPQGKCHLHLATKLEERKLIWKKKLFHYFGKRIHS